MEHASVEYTSNKEVSRNLFDDLEGGTQSQGISNNFGHPEETPVQQQSLAEPDQSEPDQPVANEPVGQNKATEQQYEIAPTPEVPGTEPAAQVVIQKSQKDLNFEILREKNKRLELEHAAAMNRVKQYEEQAMQQQQASLQQANLQQAPKRPAYQSFDGADDDLIEGKHVKGLYDQQKAMREDLAAYKQQLKVSSDEARFRTQYNDVDKVLSPENIAKLGTEQPELAKALSSTDDFYTQAVSTYKMIKKLGIYTEHTSVEDNYAAERALAQQNINKPKPLASVSPQRGNSPLSMASAFSSGSPSKDALQAAYKEMEECRKGYL